MKLTYGNKNIDYNNGLYNYGKNENSKKNFSNPSFKGLNSVADSVAQTGSDKIKKHAAQLLDTMGSEAANFIKKNITTGVDVQYGNTRYIFSALKRNFGSTFDECLEQIDAYNSIARNSKKRILIDRIFKNGAHAGKSDVISYAIDKNEDTITFHKTPFLQNVCEGVKEFTVGTILDIGIAARNGLRKLNAKFGTSKVIAKTSKGGNFLNDIFEERIAQKRAQDAFYKLSGIFEQACEGLDEISKKHVTKNAQNLDTGFINKINENIKRLAQNSISSASKKVGKYNTKSERAWNRLGTGTVSALFAATDFYNISMLQNNDPKKAKVSERKRFSQEMTRMGITASITYLVLGALQGKVNKSKWYAVFSLAGVSLISEILSRIANNTSLKPLSPEKARKIAEKREAKEKKKANNQTNAEIKSPALSNEMMSFLTKSGSNISYKGAEVQNKNVFDVFNIKSEDTQNNISFTSSENDKVNTKKKRTVFGLISKILLCVVGASLGIGFLRTKNIFNIDTIMKSMSAKYKDTIKKATRKQLVLPKEQVDGFMEFLKDKGFSEQYKELNSVMNGIKKKNGLGGAITGQARAVQKHIPKSEINPNGLYYDMGLVESESKSAVARIITYPVSAAKKIITFVNTPIKILFTGESTKQAPEKLDTETAIKFIENYSKKFQDATNKGDISVFKEDLQDAFTRHFSEANSKNNNKDIALLSRFFITLISGYFFVNDYRNEVLIESKGKDIEGANATARERVGHKFSNFLLNSMFMDIFNTTLEPIYLSSVVGATAVAMATEVTNETAVRASICTPTKKMDRDGLIEYENTRLNDKGLKGKYYRTFMKITGKKPLSSKANKSKKK